MTGEHTRFCVLSSPQSIAAGALVAGSQDTVGEVGGMLIAVVFIVGLGVGLVGLWHSGVVELLLSRRRSDSRGDGRRRQSEESTTGYADASSPSSSGDVTAEIDERKSADASRTTAQDPSTKRSDGEIILEILEQHEGRMRQAAIVEDTGWSKSKVSMVLSDMEENGEISKLRVGRENIVSLSGHEPEAAGSPFDNDAG